MGPKRAAKSSAVAGASKKAKVVKSEGVWCWEFEGDKRTWTQYGDEINAKLTEAFEADKKQVDFELDNGCKMSVNLEGMTQKNKKTGWARPIRLTIKDDTDDLFYFWSWKDDKGNFNPYAAGACLSLETARSGDKKKCDLETLGRTYKIDLNKMEQTNTDTKVVREMAREESKAVKADPDAAAPVSSSIPDSPAKGAGKSSAAAAKGSSRPARGKGKAAVKEEDDEEELPTKSGKVSRPKSGAKERPAVKTFKMSGKAPVDPECHTMVEKAHVYYEGKDIYDVMLNQTNVANNNNKYFVIQLLELNDKKNYYAWFRWGRVGYQGQNNLVPCGASLEAAKKHFMKKFSDKTGNQWANRAHFNKVGGKYDLLQMDYSGKDAEEADEVDAPKVKSGAKKPEKVPDSKLDKRVQSLIELICDVKSMEDAVVEMQYDAKKAPLGKLTSDQVKAGYAALKQIDECIENRDMGDRLTQACNEFYTRIPHDFGMRPPAKITTKQEVKKKIELLEALGDIQIALKMLKEGDKSENPVDRNYHAMKCELDPMDAASDEFKMVNTYLQNTHASTHNQYKMKIMEAYKMDKHGENEQFQDCGNRQLLWHGSRLTNWMGIISQGLRIAPPEAPVTGYMLLWHGSRLTNWMGIISQGLRIAPPEAPVTGYMFGKGVYFADMSSKSANYCFATRTKNIGILLLCEVALGTTNDLLAACYTAHKLPAGKHSTKGAGSIAPDPAHTSKTPDGALVPWGKPKNTGVVNDKGYTLNYNEFIVPDGALVPWGKPKNSGVVNNKGYTLNYNEFIVYDTKQIKMKYLLKVDFKFK